IPSYPNILGIYHSFDGSLIIVLANRTNIYSVSIVPRNTFSFWIPQVMLTNTLIPNFSLSLPNILWDYTPRFAEVNHAFDCMTLPPRLTNFPMGLLAFQDQTEKVNTGLRREVIFPHMNRIRYQSTYISKSDDNDTCSICLVKTYFHLILSSYCLNCSDLCKIILLEKYFSILRDDYSDGQIIRSADCHHAFHFDCTSQWLMQKYSCPLHKRIALTI
ncbi:hypothetical protein H5410_060371, partial [Solanum commersonii]